MIKRFEVCMLKEAKEFMVSLDIEIREKITNNIEKSMFRSDPRLFKKIKDGIWEFRTLHAGIQYRLLSFWDSKYSTSLVVITHGIKKKSWKLPPKEIEKAIVRRSQYYKQSI
jgi:phage-related protein